jgi:hypothetical protein
MKPTFRASFGQGPTDLSGGHPLLGKFGAFDDSRAHTSAPMGSQGFSQRGDGLGALPARASQQHNLLLSQTLSQPLASQVLLNSVVRNIFSSYRLSNNFLEQMHMDKAVFTVSISKRPCTGKLLHCAHVLWRIMWTVVSVLHDCRG